MAPPADRGDFGLYMTGHTHKVDLHQVEVYHQLEELPSGPEGMIVFDKGPLESISR